MLLDVVLAGLNHVLEQETWACDRLKPFSGETARLELGALHLQFSISPRGLLQTVKAEEKPPQASVTITLPADAPVRAIFDRASLLTAAHISGKAELAETLGFVFRNLRWDAEDDLAMLVGDIPARRLVQGGKRLVAWQLEQARNLARNVAEYFSEENLQVIAAREMTDFQKGTADAADRLTQLEKRVAALESRTTASSGK